MSTLEIPASEPALLRRVAPPAAATWAVLWIVSIAGEALSLRPVLFERDTPIQGYEIALALVGGSFACCGLIAWQRRPDSRIGVLMTATGFAFYVRPMLSQLPGELAVTLFTVLLNLWMYPFVALLLTFLSGGRFESQLDRFLVAAYVIPLVLGQALWMLFEPDEGYLLLTWPDADVAWVIDRVQRAMIGALCAVVVVVVVTRWLRASAPRRRALLPSLAGAFTLAMFTLLAVDGLVGGTSTPSVVWATAASLALVPLAFLAGLLRSRLARGGLAELLRGLGTMSAPDMQQALRRALGDPGLVLLVDGEPTPAGPGRAVTPVEHGRRRVATIVHDAALEDDPELLEAAASATAVALENRQLMSEAEQRLKELRESRERIVTAGDVERRRLERNLHDGAQQRLVALSMQLRLLQSRIRQDPGIAEVLATTASAELAESLQELRELARGIHPAVLDHGLEMALESLVSRSPVPASLTYHAGDGLPPAVELAAYFVASEALTNVAKYGQATAASVHAWARDGRATIEIVDDGVGGADAALGSGLRGLADRVEALNGTLRVESPAGVGTTITAELPVS
jgi:signal transduction histidine kinase